MSMNHLAGDVIAFLFEAVKGFNSCVLLLEAYFAASQKFSSAHGYTSIHRFLEIFCPKQKTSRTPAVTNIASP